MNKIKSITLILAITFPACGVIGQKTMNPQDNDEVKVGLNIGNIAPELNFKDPEGNELALSDLKGKMVLIDFWASWCRPCRVENPNLVAAYEKYTNAKWKNAKGFEIYSVSLDKNRSRWKSAIEKDNLYWKYHVSDLKGWSSKPAKIYGVHSIPTNVLLNKEGVIIGKNLKGAALHYELDKYVVKFKKTKGSN